MKVFGRVSAIRQKSVRSWEGKRSSRRVEGKKEGKVTRNKNPLKWAVPWSIGIDDLSSKGGTCRFREAENCSKPVKSESRGRGGGGKGCIYVRRSYQTTIANKRRASNESS